ncbi:MAG: SusC/RagA family TonB-linked outer membrane protein [Gemmatimonadota bacterium]|nr:SusC/RagA family TonB-linked outer membrane protein [Gemmatimonadota bacterium]MDH5548520.1 SusC/RagA family TonB-linked outer membrane protein [Gemmatimonadota bacterium]
MQRMPQGRPPFRKGRFDFFRGVGMSLLFALVLVGTALGQQVQVSGIVTSVSGEFLAGVNVGVQRTDIRVTTDAGGRYAITAPADGVLVFSFIGYRALALNVAGRSIVDVVLEPAVAVLDELIVTGYTEQRRADITGAVSSVDVASMAKQSSASVLQRLDGRVAGVTVDASGSPGSRTTVRIRGVSSFQNNDPLYIIDGTPTEDTYINWLNPNDIESIQVLKDASAASIYGSRATNGVVIIETRKRGSSTTPRFTVDVKTGMATPVRGYDDFLILDALDYHEIVKRSYENAGLPVPTNVYGDPNNPTVPAYIWPNDGVNQTTTVDENTYSFPNTLIMPGSAGTNWWDAVFDPAVVTDVNLGMSGSGEGHGYNVSLNYLNQQGTAAFNRFQRGSARVNTQFEHGRFTVGENLAVAFEQFVGGAGDPGGFAEGGILGKNILMQPVVPVYDVGGNFAAGKAVTLGNQSNPLKEAWANKDDIGKNIKVFGNVFAGVTLAEELQLTTKFGFNLNEQSITGYDPIDPELSEPSFSNGINESYSTFRDWTWSNTLSYSTTLAGRHEVDVLLGQEANQNRSRFNASSINNLITTDINARYIQDAIGDPDTKNVSSSGGTGALLSFFGKVDYNYAQRYHLSATVRRDGSSRLGPNNRWGTFPAFSVGWRMSQEPFMQDNQFFTNVMLRFGWGLTGNQSIPTGRIVSQFGGGRGDTFYAIQGGNTIAAGFRQTSLGNPDLKWEENQSINAGLDLEFFGGSTSLVIDVYQRETDNLLFDPPTPGAAGVAAPPIVNIGKMKNRGIDFSLGYTGTVGAGTWSASFNGSHYRNEIVRIDGVQDFFYGPIETRYGNQVINQIGYPIGSFYGLEADGFFEDDAAVAAHATQDGAAPGRIRFRDVNGDGQINLEDRGIIGSPHPDFTAGLDLALQMGAFDFSATVFGTFGNEIFDVQKEFYVFRNFSTNVRSDLLTDSWEPGKTDAKYPRLDANDTFSGQQISSFYIEDGSYVRLRNLQIGYRVPQSFVPETRVYVQAENLFTITGYSGLDPALPAASTFGAAGDIRDQYRGVDRGAYPSNKTISIGISAAF